MRKPINAIIILAASLLPASMALSADITVLGGMSRETTLAPGEIHEGKVILSNRSEADIQVKVYQTDYRFQSDGSNEYGEAGKLERSSAEWVAFTPSQLTVPAKSTASVAFTITVPNDVDLTGTHWSMLMLEPLAADSPEVTGDVGDEPNVAIQTVMRYGIQLITDIGDTGACALEFTNKALTTVEGRRMLCVDVTNTGERWMTPQTWAQLHDGDGASLGRFNAGSRRIFPGCSVRYSMDLTDLPPGTYNTLIVADNGDDNVFGSQAKLNIK